MSNDVSMIIDAMARAREVAEWNPEVDWRLTTHVRFAGTLTMPVTVEMDLWLRDQFERMLKSTWKLNVKIVLNNNEAQPSPQHPVTATLVVSSSHGGTSKGGRQAEYPDGAVRFVTPTGATIQDVPLNEGQFQSSSTWTGVNKEKKLRLAFKKMFIIMLTGGFLMPEDDQVKRVGFMNRENYDHHMIILRASDGI